MLAACGAYAATPDAGGVFHACIKKNGDPRVVDHDAGEDCSPNGELAHPLKREGPGGRQGRPRDPGPAGARGADGVSAAWIDVRF